MHYRRIQNSKFGTLFALLNWQMHLMLAWSFNHESDTERHLPLLDYPGHHPVAGRCDGRYLFTYFHERIPDGYDLPVFV